MDTLQQILVPTDFSPHADEAFRVACQLARAMGACVVAFHVAPPPAVVVAECQPPTDLRNDRGENLWDPLVALRPPDNSVRVEHEVIVAARQTVAHILRILEERGCDLIVMGTHGHSWLRQRLCGSLTEEVIRRARCPVMVVKAPARGEAKPSPVEETAAAPVAP